MLGPARRALPTHSRSPLVEPTPRPQPCDVVSHNVRTATFDKLREKSFLKKEFLSIPDKGRIISQHV